jgi:hypothetical protein
MSSVQITHHPNAACRRTREKLLGDARVEPRNLVEGKLQYGNLSRDLPIRPLSLGNCDEVTFLRHRPGLGDMVSLLGAIERFKAQHPRLTITLMGSEPILSIAKNHPAVDRIISEKSDLNLDSHLVDLSNPGPCAVLEGYFRSPEPANRSLLFAASIGLQRTTKPQVVITEEERAWAKQWFDSRGLKKPVGIVYRTASNIKNFLNLPELFIRVQWDFDTFLIEHEGVDEVEPNTKGLTIREQAALIAESAAIITPDTGWLHVAGALGIPLIGLFGSYPAQQTMSIYRVPTLPVVGFCPIGQQPCRGSIPCAADEGFEHPPCLSQEVDEVFPQIETFLHRYAA